MSETRNSVARAYRNPNRAALVALLAFGLTLGGCYSYHDEAFEGFSAEHLTAQGTGDGIPLQVDGAVGGVRGAALATAVAAAMPTEIDDAKVHYAPCEPYSECPGDHIVWTFGPPTARPASAYPPALAVNLNVIGNYQPPPNRVTATATLFQNGNVAATASGQVDADSPNDPGFQAMIAEMSRTVLTAPGWFD